MALLETGLKLALPTVQLLHTLADGTQHVDWMIARDATTHALLVTFRLPSRLDHLSLGQVMRIEHIGDHRHMYLTYEGPVSGDRGHVTRLAEGHIRSCAATAEGLTLHVQWGEFDQFMSLQREKSRDWLVQCVSPAANFGNNE